ncbi:MAG: AAA family ATPase [DPANN group archaeon]|nr:AAA family ATPase [DPANN group archaeon]
MKLKVGITGAHGTGKTSLAHSLVGHLKELGFNAGYIREFVRDCPLPVGTEKENSAAAQTWILCRQLIEELEAVHKYDILVCDRTVIDNYAYFLWNLRAGRLADSGLQKIAAEIFENWAHSYDIIFKLPITVPLSADGFRSTDIEWQKEIDKIISEVLSDKNIKHHIIKIASNTVRVDEILKLLNISLQPVTTERKALAELDG